MIGIPQGGSTIVASSTPISQQWMAKLKMEPGTVMTTASGQNVVVSSAGGMVFSTGGPIIATSAAGGVGQGVTALNLGSIDCYEDMFKEITKKLYGEEALTEVIDSSGVATQNIVFDDGTLSSAAAAGFQLIAATNTNGLPPGTIVLQRRVTADDKGEFSLSKMNQPDQIAFTTITVPAQQQQPMEERWFESEETLAWTTSKIARYNPAQKVFRCVDCDFVGFLSRVAEHWLGNHASLRVFQCPRCPYTSAWARCVRMHLTRQHGESLTDNSLWKENPVLEEVTKFLTGLKTRVEQKGESNVPGEKRYTCQFCSYATDRRDLFNRHENIHRDEKPFQCYVCDKQFNRADHVKKHFTRMHRDHPYDINKIKKHIPKSHGGALAFYPGTTKFSKQAAAAAAAAAQQQLQSSANEVEITTVEDTAGNQMQIQIQGQSESMTVQQIPHIAYFNPPATPGQTGPLQGIQGVGGNKKETKAKGTKKKKQGEKMYTCSYCPWQGVDNWCLKRHLNTHIKPFLCALCDYKAARSERLATHVLKVHNKRVCHKCSFLADDPESLNLHIQDSHQNPLVKTGFNCNVCQEYFEQRADLEAHAILEHQKVIVQCDLCDFRTTDELSMEAHLRDKHNLQPGMGAVAAAAAAAAAAVGMSEQSMQISVQPTMEMAEQMTIEVPEPANMQMAEPDCEVIEEVSYEQDTSSSQKNGGDSMTMSELADTDGVEEEEYEEETLCEACGCEFTDEQSLRNHQKRHRVRFREPGSNVEPRNSKAISRIYTCSTCSYNSPTSKTMMQHQRTHSGFELHCGTTLCPFRSPYDNSLKEHIVGDHKDTGPITRCPHCGVKILSMNDFTIHWRNHHSSLCGLCVNVYRCKYGIKEEGIHEIVIKTPNTIVQEEFGSENPDAETQIINDMEASQPKKPRIEFASSYRSVSNYFGSESIKFLPRFNEIQVTSLKSGNPFPALEDCDPFRWKASRRTSMAKRAQPHIIELLSRAGTSGFSTHKCHSAECSRRSFKYYNKSCLVLHKMWRHWKRTQCDLCDLKFKSSSQAFLHKLRVHPEPRQPQSQNRLVLHQHVGDNMLMTTSTLGAGTQIIFKHENV